MSEANFTLWRQDDNGQRFRVGDFPCRAAAEQRQQDLQSGGHKQLYWIESSQLPSLPQVANLLHDIPAELPDEQLETLLDNRRLRLERIISRQHATPAGTWYDQPTDEWVLLVSGSAELEFAESAQRIQLQPGDHLLIPAQLRHRVVRTDPQQDTVWLALHYDPDEQP